MFHRQDTHANTDKIMWFTNVNLVNNAKHVYQMLKNVNPNIEQIMSNDIEMTGSIEYADFAFPANSWMEFETHEITSHAQIRSFRFGRVA